MASIVRTRRHVHSFTDDKTLKQMVLSARRLRFAVLCTSIKGPLEIIRGIFNINNTSFHGIFIAVQCCKYFVWTFCVTTDSNHWMGECRSKVYVV